MNSKTCGGRAAIIASKYVLTPCRTFVSFRSFRISQARRRGSRYNGLFSQEPVRLMKSTVEQINPVQCRVSVEISSDEVNAAFDNAYRNLQKKARTQGFRPGKAP